MFASDRLFILPITALSKKLLFPLERYFVTLHAPTHHLIYSHLTSLYAVITTANIVQTIRLFAVATWLHLYV